MIRYLASILGFGKKGVAQINQRTVRVGSVPNYKLILHKNSLCFVSSNYQPQQPKIGITMLAGISPHRHEASGWQLHFVAGNREVECNKLDPDELVQVLDVNYIPVGDPDDISWFGGVRKADLERG